MFEIELGSLHVADELSGDKFGAPWGKSESEKPKRSLPRILVVDDERLIADTIADILEGAGFHATAVYDGWTALEAAARSHPDCLLSDVLMPGMNGVDLAITMHKLYPAARILLFSGQAGTSQVLLDGRKQGFEFELIPKPIHPLTLIDRLKNQQ
jgi:CheY-like chemotaxis protein